jgi:tetratricopeptide (TPR) repeat protein
MTLVLFALIHHPLTGYAQSDQQGVALLKQANEFQERARSKEDMENALNKYKEALRIFEKTGRDIEIGATLNNIGVVYNMWGQYAKALEYYEKSLAVRRKAGDLRGEAINLNNMGLISDSSGQYANALEYYERSLSITRKIGDEPQEAATLNNMASVYDSWGQYSKALEYFEKSLAIMMKIGDSTGEGFTLNDIGKVYNSRGQYAKALEYYEKSLAIMRKNSNANGEANTLASMGKLNAQTGKYKDAEKAMKQALEILQRMGVPTSAIQDDLANLYLETGDLSKAEALFKETNDNSSLGRLALMKSDYPSALKFYENAVTSSEKTGEAEALFRSYTGLARSYEGMEDYSRAEEYYEKAMNLTEKIRAGLRPSERKNFFEFKIGGFSRSEPPKDLARIRMKLNRHDGAIQTLEMTKARAFADHLSETSASGASGAPRQILEKEQSLVNRLASLKKELAKIDRAKQSGRYEILSKETRDADADLSSFVESLWKNNPEYAAVKYPRPIGIKDSALAPNECVVMFDVSGSGVLIKLIRNQNETESFFKKWNVDDLEKQVKKFREPFENQHLREFDPKLAGMLYRQLLQAVLLDVPKGTPLIIIPDGILAILPFEALVTGGKANWRQIDDENWPRDHTDYPQGITYLGDEYPISYYQSLSALTLVRKIGAKTINKDSMLVIADPVFEMNDQRTRLDIYPTLSENEPESNGKRMVALEGNAGSVFPELHETRILADSLVNMYGENCLALTGFNADKSYFLRKVAPNIGQYGSVVFATHGVLANEVPGIMEPFLALTMVPPGTDGALTMSDILALKMNADVVALTACQTGLGEAISGEGVMSMGRAFQYAGAKSVLMTLWAVAEDSSVKLTGNFFKHRKSGKSKLESLKLARDEIRKQGFEHPFFWAAFIMVGEVN